MKCWTQYLSPAKKKSSRFCSFCGAEVDDLEIHFKMNGDYLGAYCPECWAYEFPDPSNPNKYTPLMKPNYDELGKPLYLDIAINEITFNPTEFI